ncbi:hypothetical protein AHR24_01445 [Salmonella enterica subsp. diarizonae]|nr:hypothetical protein [Salmonella enterica subsp. diarizonae]EDB6595603.1 hypothetical protein [Salmonella enterica subsp. diarizonae]
MIEAYDLVRRSDGETVFSFPAGGCYQVYTTNGIASMRQMLDNEITATPATLAQLLIRLGYRVTPPDPGRKSGGDSA